MVQDYGPRMTSRAANDHGSADQNGPSVLLVEDERSIAEPFASALTRGGFRTFVAGTGEEAIMLVSELEPDVVLLDLSLPDADGRDVCRRLRLESDVSRTDRSGARSARPRLSGFASWRR